MTSLSITNSWPTRVTPRPKLDSASFIIKEAAGWRPITDRP